MYCLTYLYTIGLVPLCNLCTKGSALPPESMSVAKRTAVHSKIISKKEPTQDQRCVGSCYVCWPDRTRGQSLFVLVALINDVITETSFDSEVCIVDYTICANRENKLVCRYDYYKRFWFDIFFLYHFSVLLFIKIQP